MEKGGKKGVKKNEKGAGKIDGKKDGKSPKSPKSSNPKKKMFRSASDVETATGENGKRTKSFKKSKLKNRLTKTK